LLRLDAELATLDAHVDDGQVRPDTYRRSWAARLYRQAQKIAGAKEIVCSPDCRSVRWGGTQFTFTANQAAVVELLSEARRHGTPDIGGDTLLYRTQVDSKRLRDVFRGHPAWNTMIVEGETKGAHRLADPPTI
jgi:hypothetical protein